MPEHFPDQCFFFNRAELCAIHTVWVGAGDVELVIPLEVIKFLDHSSILIVPEH